MGRDERAGVTDGCGPAVARLIQSEVQMGAGELSHVRTLWDMNAAVDSRKAAGLEEGEREPVDIHGAWEARCGEDGDGVLARELGRAGELVLRRRRGHLEVISNGAFLISSQNEASSRALVSAAAPRLPDRQLHGFTAGLGLGYALDEALRLPGLASVVVAEIEPVIVEWFRRYGGEMARRAEVDGRVRVLTADALDVLSASESRFDLICMDTDNGPAWLVREANAVFYSPQGVRLIRSALRPAGVAVFWSPEPSPALGRLLELEIGAVNVVPAVDAVDGRHLDYLMYVAARRT